MTNLMVYRVITSTRFPIPVTGFSGRNVKGKPKLIEVSQSTHKRKLIRNWEQKQLKKQK